MGLIIGCLYCLLWYASILAGYAGLYCPLLPLLFVSNRLYRRATDALFTFWQLYPTFLLEYLCGCDIQITGDALEPTATNLLVMNHRTRTDWNFLWPALHAALPPTSLHPTKFVLKDPIRHIPGPGWVMQLTAFIYIRRRWLPDRNTLAATLAYLSQLPNYHYSLLLFPEGTDLTARTRAKSDEYALRHQRPLYAHCLHPKTTGFVCIAREMARHRRLDAVYDLTLAYTPEERVPQNEMCILRGAFPRTVRIHFRRYGRETLPTDEDGLMAFLVRKWEEKEQVLGEFFATGRFVGGGEVRRGGKGLLVVAGVFYSVLPVVVLMAFSWIGWFRWGVIYHTVFLLGVNLVWGSFPNFEIFVWRAKRRLAIWR